MPRGSGTTTLASDSRTCPLHMSLKDSRFTCASSPTLAPTAAAQLPPSSLWRRGGEHALSEAGQRVLLCHLPVCLGRSIPQCKTGLRAPAGQQHAPSFMLSCLCGDRLLPSTCSLLLPQA
ncbi:hypothetical protein H8959_003898 [Pygathrix nigripes]